jgi:hypothetical protein
LNLSLQTGHRAVLRRRPSGLAAVMQKVLSMGFVRHYASDEIGTS